ncbi:hypothetical protein [uncultured Alistipes sp.]|uniref:hypothetical protein n=1 Tax=uncultured Alistipes sp. TaxID=538949 RepID=UPI00263622BC|nr:hypothetical protein [uncultured Alistipes sp.]
MKTLITPEQVVALAYADGEYLPPEQITEADIAAAEERRIVPVVGRGLYGRLLGGAYAEFVEEYLAAPLAVYVRLAVQPLFDVRTGPCGSVSLRAEGYEPADGERLRELRRALHVKARSLMLRASARLDGGGFPEYDPRQNILKRCRTDGGFVQVG